MNGPLRQGMLPQSSIGQQQNMLSLGNPSPFMQPSGPLGPQQPLGPGSMGVPPNMPSNPPMGMLSGGPVPAGVQRYSMQPNPMQQSLQQQQRAMVPRQAQNPAQLNHAVANPSAAHMQSQLQAMPFSPSMMQQAMGGNNQIRRVQSQPQMNPLGGMPASVAGNMGMGMNPQAGMPTQLRQVSGQQPTPQQQHQLHQMRMQQQQQQQQMMTPPNMADIMMRNSAAANPAMQGSMGARSTPTQAQVMSSLTQPSPLGSAPPGSIQPQHHQNAFSNGQMRQPQLSPSPRPTSTQGMSMAGPGPSHPPANRLRASPDSSNPMAYNMGFPGNQFPGSNVGGRGIPSNVNPSYPFVPSSSPTMQMTDLTQSSTTGMVPSQNGSPANKTTFFPTPAQQRDISGVDMYGPSMSMPPPSSIPPRPPSHGSNPHQQLSHPLTPQNQTMLNPQQQRPPQRSPTPQQQAQQQQQQQAPHQLSPEQMNMQPQRSQSQPQRPRSQQGGTNGIQGNALPSSSQAPRSLQPPLPPAFSAGLTSIGRIPQPQPPPPQSQQQQQQQGSGLPAIAPRPPTGGPQSGGNPLPRPPTVPPVPGVAHQALTAGTPQAAPTATSPPPTAGVRGLVPPGPAANNIQNAIGQGQGLMRLLQFSGVLASESKTKYQLSFWNEMIKEYFTPKAVMKLTLWKDNQRNEAKPFEIGVPILPRFFLVTTQSGVKSMTLSLDGARERIQGTGHAIVECVAAVWTYKYTNGYTITLRGPLTAHVIITATHPPGNNNHTTGQQYTYKFEEFQFDANNHDKYIALDSIMGSRSIENLVIPSAPMTPSALGQSSQQQQADEEKKWEEPRVLIEHGSIPGEPANAFGIPQATMRCLELAESVAAMSELIQYAKETTSGPMDALKEFSQKLRDSGAVLLPPQPQQHQLPPPHGQPMHVGGPFYSPAASSTASSQTLYSSVSPSMTNPSVPTSSTMSSPPNTAPSATNSPEKQPKTIPQQQQQNQTPAAAATSPAISTASNTPSMANASLKRKQTGDAASPTMGSDQPPPKRVPRKRGRLGNAGTS